MPNTTKLKLIHSEDLNDRVEGAEFTEGDDFVIIYGFCDAIYLRKEDVLAILALFPDKA